MKHGRADYQRIQDPERKIGEYEPVFLVRAQDPAAPAAVEAWAAENDRMGGDRALSDQARKTAARMRDWPVKKVADAPDVIDAPDEKPELAAEGGVADGKELGGGATSHAPAPGIHSGSMGAGPRE